MTILAPSHFAFDTTGAPGVPSWPARPGLELSVPSSLKLSAGGTVPSCPAGRSIFSAAAVTVSVHDGAHWKPPPPPPRPPPPPPRAPPPPPPPARAPPPPPVEPRLDAPRELSARAELPDP